ncbi:thiamine pyrophosphate-dependent dehydrogenase E1 component subunit alpha [Actinacidiphila bryophytorum]|uniref:thiamine pyrophosphate-dependent dehydrogenase E1 component subunit alpha n=1 Tax=Actinacidiphila bryophytorum TaxID=1436133 RepID=UPI002176DF71|nr:thiamine pyrophosphate-dependent dehydrogenase E1 component subunit alpha [Actinacidiphila bryophytorum]UWE08640.1 thiamine pyrophosphate-dependent dehydrogenase E1 component subunit alpha [Actinacidiphila bryophytorum]
MIGAEPPAIGDEDLRLMLLIRQFEERVLELVSTGEISGTTHTCIGQEYIPVALRPLLSADDFVLSNHRGHGHYLARSDDAEGLLAELMGREGGVCAGVGGSQHLHRDTFLSSGVQGQNVPVAVGAALHFRRAGQPRCAVAHIGDGTWGEGAVYEALNMAALWQVPLILVVENNGIAQTTPVEAHMAGDVARRAAAFAVPYLHMRGSDVAALRDVLHPAVHRARTAPHPLVVEFETTRVGPHSKGDDTRDADSLSAAHAADWYPAYRAAHPEQTRRLAAAVSDRLDAVVDAVRRRGLSRWSPTYRAKETVGAR